MKILSFKLIIIIIIITIIKSGKIKKNKNNFIPADYRTRLVGSIGRHLTSWPQMQTQNLSYYRQDAYRHKHATIFPLQKFDMFLKFKTPTMSNNRFAALVAQKHRAISGQEKMTFSSPARVSLGLPSPFPRVCQTDGGKYVRAYADVRTKFSCIDRLPYLLSNGASAGSATNLLSI